MCFSGGQYLYWKLSDDVPECKTERVSKSQVLQQYWCCRKNNSVIGFTLNTIKESGRSTMPCYVEVFSVSGFCIGLYCGAVKAWWGSSPYTGPIKIFFISLRIEKMPGEGWNRIKISQIGATRYTKGNMPADILR